MPRPKFFAGIRRRRRVATAATAAAALVGAMGLVTVTSTASAAATARHTVSVRGVKGLHTVSSGGITVAYFDQWSIYANNYFVKDLVTSGVINHINYLIYDFENISPTAPYTCFEAEHATDPDPAGENDPNAGDGAGDVDADYGKPFTAAQAVNGQADTSGQLAGNFHQLQELKAQFPNLKILLSLGGWTYSKYFSDAAATAASRQTFVSSCINMFLKGNLPPDADYGVTPAPGAISGLFDGFDLDWEYPGAPGHLGNHVSPNDTQNYTLLLQEFRNELNTLGSSTGKTYYLSAALPSGQDKISKVQTDQIGQYLNFGDLMAYDMHGGFEANGPTNFQDPLFNDPADPSPVIPPGNQHYSITNAVNAWVNGDPSYSIPGGFPASKLTLGMPLYYRDWTGVSAGSNHGLYMPASGPGPGFTYSGNVPGVEMYKELTNGPFSSGMDIVDNPADTYYDAAAGAAYFYSGNNFWTGLSPQSIKADIDFMHCQGMAGVMMFSMYDQDPTSPVLFNDIENALGTTPGSCAGQPFSVSVSPTSASVSPGGSATATVSTQLLSGSAQTVTFSAAGAPSGVTVGFSPTSVTTGSSSTMTVATSSTTTPGSYPITVTGTAGSVSESATYTLTVTGSGGNNFSVSVSPSSATVAPGSSATATVSTQLTSGSAQTVTLSAYGKPTGVTTSFVPKSVTTGASSTMTIKVASTVATGTYKITVKGKALSGTKLATYTLTVGTSGGGGPLVNGGFESGSLSPWVCQSGDVTVSSPVHSGSFAAQITPTASQTGECDQSVTLKPNTSYTLTGWVQGNFAYIGVSGDASASTWTSSSGWSQLTVPFTTGSTGNVTVFVHGWYSQGNVYADDFSLN
ncbi:MAG TPA: glycosyl hydrolase family 18 protein [Streptosporangiaceae bacterium]|nr:glycosyl hydrolase family 18 protein [Streptosporangiaceae bacterium]